MKQVIAFCKKEIVLCLSLILALISMIWVPIDRTYISYIDFRTLSILLSLMLVMAGFRQQGVFKTIGRSLLKKTGNVKGLSMVLVLLCFVFSMLITNDVALITFVPFTIEVLVMCKLEQYMIRIIVLQTIAANLGSMLTPIGNPQNLYLYGLSGVGMGTFIGWMLPYTVVSLVLLILCILIFKGSEKTRVRERDQIQQMNRFHVVLYLILFVVSLLTVVRVLPYPIALLIVVAAVVIFDRWTMLAADYALLLTFIFLFIFIGNMKRIPQISLWLSGIVQGHETLVGVVSSQVVSNVPAAILLSGFTDQIKALVIGTNLGGLGTLIASMASLISFKFYGALQNSNKDRYMAMFTVFNVIFLIILYGFHLIYCAI